MRFRLVPALIAILLHSSLVCAANAVRFRGIDYVHLDALLSEKFLNGTAELTYWGRNIVITLPDCQVIIENGGDRIRDRNGLVHHLTNPILVLGRDWYLPVEESAPIFNVEFSVHEPLVTRFGGKTLLLEPEDILADYPFAQVRNLRPESKTVELTRSVNGWSCLGESPIAEALEAGTTLVLRRTVSIDDEDWVIATTNDELLESWLIRDADVANSSREVDSQQTYVARLLEAARALASHERAIRYGPRERRKNQVALTSDLCWSLRPCENRLYEMVSERAADGRPSSITNFITGRWLQQYPLAVHDLIFREQQKGYHQVWGLHSWDHPKSGIFMNAYAPESLRGDTLALEKKMLEWGIVPDIFYRFPGLIHDRVRLETIIDLGLIPVDCDSWVSGMHLDRLPTRLKAQSGSILLVHGNGNEARGIDRLFKWVEDNPEFDFAPLGLFVDPDAALEDARARAVMTVN